jgi:hypothetical protein
MFIVRGEVLLEWRSRGRCSGKRARSTMRHRHSAKAWHRPHFFPIPPHVPRSTDAVALEPRRQTPQFPNNILSFSKIPSDNEISSFEMSEGVSSRPYRSHKFPACQTCRNRKIRCHIDEPGVCRFCKERNLTCNTTTESRHASITSPSRLSRKRKNASNTVPRSDFLSPNESSAMIVNQTLAEDVEVLENYLTSTTAAPAVANKPYSKVSHQSGDSVFYLTLPKRRPKLHTSAATVPGKAQREIMKQILYPYESEVIEL